MLLSFLKEKTFQAVFLATLAIAAGLTIACWRMNPWPSDAEVYYMPAAKSLFTHQYLSQMHAGLDEERIKWLHGKEMHVLAIACLQRAMHDTQTLRPLVILGVVSIFFASLFLYLIARRLWGEVSAIIVWFLFASSCWPYLYILFTKHQTQGLMLFTLSVLLIVYARHGLSFLLAGLAMGASIFSSTVSIIYMPLVAATFLLNRKKMFVHAAWFATGISAIVMVVNWPDVVGNLRSYGEYIRISGAMNHFFYNQKILVQWLPSDDLKDTRGGLLWIAKYLFLMIPSVMVIFWMCFYRSFGREGKDTFFWFLLGCSGLLLAEMKGVAQYGANYFPVFIGLLMFIGWSMRKAQFKAWWVAVALLILGWNVVVFSTDIYPSRMVTTKISDFLDEHHVERLYTFAQHPLRQNILDHLNPTTLNQLQVVPIESVVQVNDGFILLPPVSTDSIYRASNGDYNDFDIDLMLNNIVRQGKLKDYAVKGFRTLGSSLIWSQEEEILAYRYLVKGQFKNSDLDKAWILDARKIARDRALLLPSQEDLFLQAQHVRNIGSLSRRNIYPGYTSGTPAAVSLKGLAARVFKVGNPTDELRAFVFKLDDKQPMWVPYAKGFISKPLPASNITSGLNATPVIFTFDPPLAVNAGPFYVTIYRTGKPSDADYYRIFADGLGRIEQ